MTLIIVPLLNNKVQNYSSEFLQAFWTKVVSRFDVSSLRLSQSQLKRKNVKNPCICALQLEYNNPNNTNE